MNVLNEDVEQQAQDISFTNYPESKNELDQSHLVYGKELQSPILGHHYQLPELPTNYVPATILDTSLPYIPVYAHLKIYDIKPVRRPETPLILSTLYLQFPKDTCRSSREISSSVARISGEDAASALCSVRDDTQTTSLVNQSTRACDLNHFVVFVDVAKYTDWITEQISTD